MKKLLVITTFSLMSSLALADRAIVLQPGEPLPMGAKPDNVQNRSTHNSSYTPTQFSLAGGYAGSKIGSNEFGGDEKFNGFFLNASTPVANKTSVYAEYAYQEASGSDFSEVSAGIQYKAIEDGNMYAAVGGGIGYAWLDESGYIPEFGVYGSAELNYVTLPVHFELGYKANQNLDVFGNAGYKWFFNRDSEACIEGTCVSGSSSDLDVDGVTYKAGLRYNF